MWDTRPVRVLLTDGTGLTSRQVATQLGRAGHHVEVLTPDPIAITRFTQHVRRVHRVPPYGADPFAWLEAALAVAARRRMDLLLPTQEQAAVLSCRREVVAAAGFGFAVPSIESLRQVQDKATATATLERFGVPQPPTEVRSGPAARDRLARSTCPCTRRAPSAPLRVASASCAIGPSSRPPPRSSPSGGRARSCSSSPSQDRSSWRSASSTRAGSSPSTPTCARERARTGASHKTSVAMPDLQGHLERLGAGLAWHGALSVDAIDAGAGGRW